jgi:hypothetical protein
MVTTEEINKICSFLDNLNALTDAEIQQVITSIKLAIPKTPNTTIALDVDNPSKLIKIVFENGNLKELIEE